MVSPHGRDHGSYFLGQSLRSSAEASTNPISWGPNLTVEVGRQTDGSQEWHHLYGIPSWGLGFSLASFGNGAHHTRPIEAYTILLLAVHAPE